MADGVDDEEFEERVEATFNAIDKNKTGAAPPRLPRCSRATCPLTGLQSSGHG